MLKTQGQQTKMGGGSAYTPRTPIGQRPGGPKRFPLNAAGNLPSGLRPAGTPKLVDGEEMTKSSRVWTMRSSSGPRCTLRSGLPHVTSWMIVRKKGCTAGPP